MMRMLQRIMHFVERDGTVPEFAVRADHAEYIMSSDITCKQSAGGQQQ